MISEPSTVALEISGCWKMLEDEFPFWGKG